MLNTLIAYIVPLLAAYRLSYLVANERGPFDGATALRSWVLRRVGLDSRHWLYEGATCVRCLSWWLALPCVALAQWGGWGGALLIGWWGVAGGVLVLAQVLDAISVQAIERKAQSVEPTHAVPTIVTGMSEKQLTELIEQTLNRTLNRRTAGWS